MSELANPKHECDLVMKGGIASGIVYPSAIHEIAKKYKFVSIGGASAGAIAAAGAAAAEYQRQKALADGSSDQAGNGFDRLNEVPENMGQPKSLFQPSPSTRPLFRLFEFSLWTKSWTGWARFPAIALSLLYAYWPTALLLGLLSCGINPLLEHLGQQQHSVLIWLIWSLILILTLIAKVFGSLTQKLPENEFGVCTGLSQKPSVLSRILGRKAKPALTEWLADTIDQIAFDQDNIDDQKPLCVGDICIYDIHLAAKTTDLSSKRPYQLPLKTKIFHYRQSEFERIFPERVMNHILSMSEPAPQKIDGKIVSGWSDDMFVLPEEKHIPLVLIARLSLSFPFLITAVPIYRLAFSKNGGEPSLLRCHFSDGGISSNFPVHLFDSILPNRPTLGISLGEKTDKQDSVVLPKLPYQHPIHKLIQSLGDFQSAILNSAKDWQDTLQANLPSYAERIVTINLDPKTEGGLNLNMPPDKIKKLKLLGQEAGEKLVNEFRVSRNRYDRLNTALPLIEDMILSFDRAYHAPPWEAEDHGKDDWDWILLEAKKDMPKNKAKRGPKLHKSADHLSKLAKTIQKIGPLKEDRSQDAKIRVIANPDRIPADYEPPCS